MSSILNITQPQTLSFSHSIPTNFNFIIPKLGQLSLKQSTNPNFNSIIRMGGGPRTFPGGVSKWQWKRMQARKAKQLLKARLCRERQIYEMRKRAELKSAVAELEKPWEVVERAPTLFSVKADEQLKVLADRFQKAGGFDMWSDHDGPQLFGDHTAGDEDFPSSRFFPKGVVHSLKPYQKVSDSSEMSLDSGVENGGKVMVNTNGGRRNSIRLKRGSSSDGDVEGKQLSLNDDDDDRLSMISLDSGTEGGEIMGIKNGSRRNSMRRLKSSDGEVEGKQLSSSSRESSNKGPKQGNLGGMESMRLEGGKSMVRNVIRKRGRRQISGSMDSKKGNGDSGPLTSTRRNGHLRRGGDRSLDLKQGNGDSEPPTSRRNYHKKEW